MINFEYVQIGSSTEIYYVSDRTDDINPFSPNGDFFWACTEIFELKHALEKLIEKNNSKRLNILEIGCRPMLSRIPNIEMLKRLFGDRIGDCVGVDLQAPSEKLEENGKHKESRFIQGDILDENIQKEILKIMPQIDVILGSYVFISNLRQNLPKELAGSYDSELHEKITSFALGQSPKSIVVNNGSWDQYEDFLLPKLLQEEDMESFYFHCGTRVYAF